MKCEKGVGEKKETMNISHFKEDKKEAWLHKSLNFFFR